MIVVTGTGRCGTRYVAKLLTSAGVSCGHEEHFTTGGWDGERENDASWQAAPYLSQVDAKVVHLVRHPKDVMDSLRRMAFFNPRYRSHHSKYVAFVEEHMVGDSFEDTRMQSAHFYYQWNRMIEKEAPDAIRHRIEDDDTDLLDALGIDYEDRELYANTSDNHRGGPIVSDVDLRKLREPCRGWILSMCEEYGYDPDGGLL